MIPRSLRRLRFLRAGYSRLADYFRGFHNGRRSNWIGRDIPWSGVDSHKTAFSRQHHLSC